VGEFLDENEQVKGPQDRSAAADRFVWREGDVQWIQAPGRSLSKLLDDPTLSSYRESLLEAIFVSDLIQAAWRGGYSPVELAHAFVDFQGYDLIATCGPVTRHIQLKALRSPRITLHKALLEKPSACCILLRPTVIGEGIAMKYRFFGGEPGEALEFPADARVAKRSTPAVRDGEMIKPERANHVIVPRSLFEPQSDASMSDLLPLLFGDA
jgi:hypothetical protein